MVTTVSTVETTSMKKWALIGLCIIIGILVILHCVKRADHWLVSLDEEHE
jgi:hypothetical protein